MTPFVFQIVATVLAISILALVVWLFILERRMRKLLLGKNAQSLEGVIGTLGADIRALEIFRDETSAYLKTAEMRLRRSIQGVETIRFNAFKGNGEGGNQSFAIALLSEDGDGTVVSSLYARDHVNIFAKPIKNFSSEFEMTAEERDAVTRTKRS